MNPLELFAMFDSFEWDSGNLEKNVILHDVTSAECEEAFFNFPIIIGKDLKHPDVEKRFYALGRTDRDRFIFQGFVIRNRKVRIFTARDMNKKEGRMYEEAKKRNTPFSLRSRRE